MAGPWEGDVLVVWTDGTWRGGDETCKPPQQSSPLIPNASLEALSSGPTPLAGRGTERVGRGVRGHGHVEPSRPLV